MQHFKQQIYFISLHLWQPSELQIFMSRQYQYICVTENSIQCLKHISIAGHMTYEFSSSPNDSAVYLLMM